MKKILILITSLFLFGCTLDEDLTIGTNINLDSGTEEVEEFRFEVADYVEIIHESNKTLSILKNHDALDATGNLQWYLDYIKETEKELIKMKLYPITEEDDIIFEQFSKVHILCEEVNEYAKLYLNKKGKYFKLFNESLSDFNYELHILAELYLELY